VEARTSTAVYAKSNTLHTQNQIHCTRLPRSPGDHVQTITNLSAQTITTAFKAQQPLRGYTFVSIQAPHLDKSIPRGHISDKEVAEINKHRRGRGVEEICFDACFAAGVIWWKDGKSTTKLAAAKAHPDIEEWHRRATWFPNAQGTPTMKMLTSTRAHTAKTCVRD
jgi:hypothetical protein